MCFVASLKRCRVLSSSRLVEMQKLNDNFVKKLLQYIICIIILNDISILKFIIYYYFLNIILVTQQCHTRLPVLILTL